MKKVFIRAMISVGLVIASMMAVNASAIEKPNISAGELKLPDDYYILAAMEEEVTGDEFVDSIYLIGHKNKPDALYQDELSIIVKSGTDELLTVYPLKKVGGYQTKLFAGDFSGDKVADVYVAVESGGSGGWSYHNIVSFKEQNPQELFGMNHNQSQSISGKFIDGWKVELTNCTGGKMIAIDVRERQNDYIRLGIYDENGMIKKETQTMTAPFAILEPIDRDHDGVFELKGIQRISGGYRADGIADVETILKYKDAVWNASSVRVIVNMNSVSE